MNSGKSKMLDRRIFWVEINLKAPANRPVPTKEIMRATENVPPKDNRESWTHAATV